jgi:hypothetical protein
MAEVTGVLRKFINCYYQIGEVSMMIPSIIIQLALLIILVRSGYRFVQGLSAFRKNWLEVLFDLSIAIIALSFLI